MFTIILVFCLKRANYFLIYFNVIFGFSYMSILRIQHIVINQGKLIPVLDYIIYLKAQHFRVKRMCCLVYLKPYLNLESSINFYVTICYNLLNCEQKYHYNQATQQTYMKGVKINNYIDNRIVLSSRKLKNQVQTLIHTNRPRPLVIRNVNYVQQEEDGVLNTEQKQTLKALQSKSAKKQKKKSKNSNVLNHELKNEFNQKQQKKNKPRKLSNRKNTSTKKRQSSSSPSGNEQIYFNQTQKKIKSVQKNGEGLGKRSKSAIIKRNKSPSNAIIETQKKNFQDMNMKINLNKKKDGQVIKKKVVKKQKKSSANKQKPLKKNLSSLNVSQRKKPHDKQIGTKTSRAVSKSYMSSSKQSKPVSARQNKKKDSNSNNIIKNLFHSQEHIQKQPITLQKLLNIQKTDFKFKDVLSKLQLAINTQGSRKKLSQKLELLAEKIKQIESQQSQQEQIQEKKQQLISEGESVDSDCIELGALQQGQAIQQFLPSVQQNYKEPQQKNQEVSNKFTNTKIISKIKQQQKELIVQKQINSKQSKNNYFISSIQNEIAKIVEEKRENYKKDSDYLRQNLQRENGVYDQNEEQQNPLIGRKIGGDPYVDLVDYDSINSVKSNQQSDKKNQINQLKKFQQQSDLMMKKIKQLQQKKKKQQQSIINLKPQQELKLLVQPTNVPSPIVSSPKGLQIKNYAFQKYPTVQSLKSPKFNTQQIIQVIKLKEKIVTDRHQKLSQLVNVMFDKKIVSPKTYSIHIQSLREQQIQNNEVLDSYRKHAEQLAQLLIQIKKQKQQISSIDELIREQKWNQAMTVIKSNEKKKQNASQNLGVNQRDTHGPPKSRRQQYNDDEDDDQQEPVYYEGQQSQNDSTAIKLIQVQHQQINEQNQKDKPSQVGKAIKIDESNNIIPKKQKGFDSNLFFIKQYCIALCQYVRDFNKQDFRNRIGQPMKYNLIDLLKGFRTNRDGSIPLTINSLYQDLRYHDIVFHENCEPISFEIFEKFNKQHAGIKYYGKQQSQDAKLEGIFLKAIFDALNQSISIQKPGSINGKALPWANSSKHLKNLKNSLRNSCDQQFRNQQSQDLIFGIAIARIIQWGSCLCGFIPDTVELENTQIDEQYINHIRQTRTALLLQKMLIDEQATMYRTQLAETQVKLSLEQMILDELSKQVSQQMRKIVLRATLRDVDY